MFNTQATLKITELNWTELNWTAEAQAVLANIVKSVEVRTLPRSLEDTH